MGIAEPVIGRAFARPVGSTHPTTDIVSRSRGALRPEFYLTFAPSKQRAQGRPGARCTRGLACNCAQQKRTRAYRFSGSTPAFPAQWLYGLLRALVSAKSARMCERAVLTNRPSLDLSPIALKGLESLSGSEGQIRCLPQPEQLHGL